MFAGAMFYLVLDCHTRQSIIRNKLPKGPYVGSFGAKPAWASAFIGVSILMDIEALAGFAMPTRASAFDRFWCSILTRHY